MTGSTLLSLGGVGMFLLGMVMLMDGLRGLAGQTLRGVLTRFTNSPVSGAATGAATTAVLQSSSATTVSAVGFVGAGLMTFPQALGVIFGANVGTTFTGWIVALVGFKLELGLAALPGLLVGVLLRLYGRGRTRDVGWALAGFSLLFVGIDTMKEGMGAFQGLVTPDAFPSLTVAGALQLVAIGIAITVVTQSSSAGVAAALAAMAVGAITLPQAAAMVIGMDIGTTFTAALATVGGTTEARRTGFAHVIYNVLTAIMAFLLLGPYVAVAEAWLAGAGRGDAQVALVAFHTGFNLIGTLLILPFAVPFARLVVWLIPERGPALVRHLDVRSVADPAVAVEQASTAVDAVTVALAAVVAARLADGAFDTARASRLAEIEQAIATTHRFVGRVQADPTDTGLHARHLSALHVLDHLGRLAGRCHQSQRIRTLRGDHRLRRLAAIVRHGALLLADGDVGEATTDRLDRVRALLRRQSRTYRRRSVEDAVARRIDADMTLKCLDAIRWLDRVAYHLWRIASHRQRPEIALETGVLEEVGD